jgi:hypothetical protein
MFDVSYAPSALDSRNDLGYGKTKSSFHGPRMKGDGFPYVDDSSKYYDEDDDFEDLDSEDAIASFTSDYKPVDYLRNRSVDRFYVSSIKLVECFTRPDYVLKEIHEYDDTLKIRSKNNQYNQVAAHGAAHSGFPGGSLEHPTGSRHFRLPGSKQGYFSPPPKKYMDPENDPFDQNIFDLEDLACKIMQIIGR